MPMTKEKKEKNKNLKVRIGPTSSHFNDNDFKMGARIVFKK